MKPLRVLATTLAFCLVSVPAVAERVRAEPARIQPMLDEALHGEATGRGRFKSGLIGLDRGFVVTTRGRKAGGVFILDQVFRFDDGKIDRRTWRFQKTGPRSYSGTRRDVIGEASVTVESDIIRMSYDVEIPRKDGSKLRLHFDDTISRLDRRTLLNKAVVSTLGIPVGSVEARLVRR